MRTCRGPEGVRVLAILSLLALAPILAGCATAPSPVGDAEAGHAGALCPEGRFVNGFLATGSPNCAAPPAQAPAAFTCPDGEVMVGFTAEGAPRCADFMAVAQKAKEKNPPPEPSRPARMLSLTSTGAIRDGVKGYAIASASPSMRWSDLSLTVDGRAWTLDPAGACPRAPSGEGRYLVCGPQRETADATVDAGDTLAVGGISSGQTIRLIDVQANAVILTLTVG